MDFGRDFVENLSKTKTAGKRAKSGEPLASQRAHLDKSNIRQL